MKKRLALAAIIIMPAFLGCKKTVSADLSKVDISGTWAVVSESFIEYGVAVVYDANEFPCVSEEELVIKADSTFEDNYTGKDTCFVANNPANPPSNFITWLYSPLTHATGTFASNDGGYRFLYDGSNYHVHAEVKQSDKGFQLVITDVNADDTSLEWVYVFERKK